MRGPLSPAGRLAAILTDFAELTDIMAARKIMMFAFAADLLFDEVVNRCARQDEPLAPNEEYLLLGWPVTARWNHRVEALRCHRFSERQK